MIYLVADQTRREHVKLMEKTKKGSGTTDLTVGRPLPQILKFALPLVLGTLFQQLYSFVDTVIVGRCLGTDALGAVGTTYSLNFLILGFVLGSCTGFGIRWPRALVQGTARICTSICSTARSSAWS